ncbi:MAG: hypothetical protein OXP69_01575 [Spirochaetaceae bacterium]|nr:hypothetical protein [Spirochaetaceae bacterium]
MTTRVVPVAPRTVVGGTVMVAGRPAVTLQLLPRLAGRPRSARVTYEPSCRLCEASLHWQQPARGWRCLACDDTPSTEQLAEWAREHVGDGVSGGRGRRRLRQVARGAPGAAVLLLRTAAAGGALSRAALIDGASGAERQALWWALRDAGDRPLSAERCRAAAVELDSLTSRTLREPP